MKLRQFLDNLDSAQLADRLNLALEGAHLGIWDWDLRDNSVQFDRRWCEMLGLDHAATHMELASWSSRVHPDDIESCYADIQAYLRGETPYYENIHRMRHADGHWVYILDRGRVSGRDADGKAIRFTGTHFDCTTTEEARRLVEAQQDQLARLVRDLPVAVALLDDAGRYVSASAAWTTWFGQENSRAGETPEDHGYALPAEWKEAFARARRGEEVTDLQLVMPCPSSREPRTLRLAMRPMLPGVSAAGGVIIRLDDRTQELQQRAAAEAHARLSSLGMMAGGIAHEMNTPLQALALNAEMALDELSEAEPDIEFVRETVSEALETTRYMASIVQAMRTLTRRTSDQTPAPVDLADIIQQVVRMGQARLRDDGVELTVDCAAGLEVQARAGEVAQIVLNLLSNAIDAALGGDSAWVRIEATRGAVGTTVSVSDSGPGIPPDLRAAIMAPFFTTKGTGKGTGLGLSLSRSLAEGMGAALTLDSDAPHTTFRLHFPDDAS